MSRSKMSCEIAGIESVRRMSLANSLLKSGLKTVDEKTKLDGWFGPLGKQNIERGVKDGILAKSGKSWKVNVPELKRKYGMPGLCR